MDGSDPIAFVISLFTLLVENLSNELKQLFSLITSLFDMIIDSVIQFVLNVVFFLPTVKAEEQGNIIFNYLYKTFSRFDFDNYIFFFIGFVFFIFCFKTAFKIISIIRG